MSYHFQRGRSLQRVCVNGQLSLFPKIILSQLISNGHDQFTCVVAYVLWSPFKGPYRHWVL